MSQKVSLWRSEIIENGLEFNSRNSIESFSKTTPFSVDLYFISVEKGYEAVLKIQSLPQIVFNSFCTKEILAKINKHISESLGVEHQLCIKKGLLSYLILKMGEEYGFYNPDNRVFSFNCSSVASSFLNEITSTFSELDPLQNKNGETIKIKLLAKYDNKKVA